MASPVVWIRQLSGASLDLSHSDLVRYRCYEKICGCTSSAFADLHASLATGVYMVHGSSRPDTSSILNQTPTL